MVYTFLKNVVNLGSLIYFKKVYISGMENVPKNTPVLFTTNHTNALVDPVMIGVKMSYPIHYITRGDVFNSKTEWLFAQLNMYPIFRIRDGYDKLDRNVETFNTCFRQLKKNAQIIIFSEGDCEITKQLRPLKKGTARMSFQALEEHDIDVHIVPVGLNYTNHTAFRGELMIHFGEAFKISDFKEIHDKNKARGIKAFNKRLTSDMKDCLVNLNNLEELPLLEYLLEMVRSDEKQKVFPLVARKNDTRFKAEKAAADYVNQVTEAPTEKFNAAKEKVFQYFQLLKQHNLTDAVVGKSANFLATLILLILFPIFFLIMLPSAPLYLVADRIAKTKIKQDIFISTFRQFLYTFAYAFVLLPIFLLIFGLIYGWYGVLGAFLIPILGYFYLPIREGLKKQFALMRYGSFRRKNAQVNEQLVNTRAEIIEMMKN